MTLRIFAFKSFHFQTVFQNYMIHKTCIVVLLDLILAACILLSVDVMHIMM